MVEATLFLEGGGQSKELRTRCREGFRKLIDRLGLEGRQPRLVACGGRGQAFKDFVAARTAGRWVALWVDSEDPMTDLEAAWDHLKARDGWARPKGAEDSDVLLMVTCMETWFCADHAALKEHYQSLQASALPSLHGLESRDRHDVQDALVHATRECSNQYAKTKRSFALLGLIDPGTVERHCPSLGRCRRILHEKL
jgi:hypothetical protein